MASIISAGNATNGLAVSSDNTGILELKTGTGAGTVGLTIDASQAATFAGAVTTTGAITATGGIAGDLKFNSGYGSVAVAYGCRAWANIDGVNTGTFAGGTSTVTRVAGSTTATVTTTTAHGLITGNFVYAASGVVAGLYTVTKISDTSFSFITVATTALTAASITFTVSPIRGAGNISSVARSGTGQYAVNFAIAMPDANYSVTCAGNFLDTFGASDNTAVGPRNLTVAGFYCQSSDGTNNTFQDSIILSIAVFR
jgi:hypothetical protein